MARDNFTIKDCGRQPKYRYSVHVKGYPATLYEKGYDKNENKVGSSGYPIEQQGSYRISQSADGLNFCVITKDLLANS